jgi:hypothetical protein
MMITECDSFGVSLVWRVQIVANRSSANAIKSQESKEQSSNLFTMVTSIKVLRPGGKRPGLIGALVLLVHAFGSGWLGKTGVVESFVFAPYRVGVRDGVSALLASTESDDDEKGIPQLPAIGSSSRDENAPKSNDENKPFVASRKFQLQYTCNICETRNTHSVSRTAYRNGVVIVRCKGCESQHIIADHLGYTDYEGGFQGNETNTIEDFFADHAEGVKVDRVSEEVFQLEKILLGHDADSGSIVGDDGELAME